MKFIVKAASVLVQPPQRIVDPEQRRALRLLAELVLIIIVLGALTTALQLIFYQMDLTTLTIVIGVIVLLSIAYIVARMGKFLPGIATAISSILLGCAALVIFSPDSPIPGYFMILAVLLAGTFLTVRHTLITALAAVALTITALMLAPEAVPAISPLLPIMFLLITSSAIVLARHFRDELERNRKRQLVESERRYELAIEAAQEGIWEWDILEEQVYLSPKALAIIGWDSRENTIASEVWQQRLHPDDFEEIERAMTAYLEGTGPPFNKEHRVIADTGKEIWVYSRGTVVSDDSGVPIKVVGSFSDITEKKEVAENIIQSERQLKRAQRIGQIGDWSWDLNTNEISWSDEMYRIYDIAPDVKSDDLWPAMEQRIHPEDKPRVQAVIADSLVSDIEISFEYRLVMPDGSIKHVLGEGEPVFDASGNLFQRIGIVQDISDIKRAEQALRNEKNFVNAILHSANSLVVVLDSNGCIVRFNRACEELTGYTFDEVSGKHVWDLFLEKQDIAPVRQVFKDLRASGLPGNYQNIWLTKDGRKRMIEWSNSVVSENHDNVSFVVGLGNDITDRIIAEAERDKHARALDQSADSVMITDPDGVIEYVNPAYEDITGYSREELIGQNPRIVKSNEHDLEFYQRMWAIILKGEVFRDVLINRAKDGHLYYEEKTITPLLDRNGKLTSFVSTGKDISERMETQERMYYLAHHDILTKLPNRVLFLERLGYALTGLDRRHQTCAILFLDLDRFKNINDTLGHDVGDGLLQSVGERLKDAVREGDTVARLGGDEFTVLLEDIQSADDIAPIARKVLSALSTPFHVAEHELFTSASIGISMYPDDGADPKSLLKNADAAMYRAKDQGRNNYQYYSAEMGVRARETLTLETSLRHALERDEFELFYQPQINLNDGATFGVEALLRWRHPERGIILPNQFIPLLEDTGLIVEVGQWVVQQACDQWLNWQKQGIYLERMSVNLSGRQFDEFDFLEDMLRVVGESGIREGVLEFEITESLLLQHAQYTVDVLEQLNRNGIRLAIDDFGTGYSSLSYLKRFPVDTIKIDQSFVRDVITDPGDAEIVKAILAMAKSLKIDVIAEGVETKMQEDFLSDAGCKNVQGYLYARPCSAADFATNNNGKTRAG